MKAYSKAIAAVVGVAAGIATSFGLPEALATPEMQSGVVAIITGIVVYLAPANEPTRG